MGVVSFLWHVSSLRIALTHETSSWGSYRFTSDFKDEMNCGPNGNLRTAQFE